LGGPATFPEGDIREIAGAVLLWWGALEKAAIGYFLFIPSSNQ
jgi:hypothetical protein